MTMSICEREGERGGEGQREREGGWERERGRGREGEGGRGGGERGEREGGGRRDRVCIYGNPPTTRNVQHTSEHNYIHVINQILNLHNYIHVYIIYNVNYIHTNDINF